MCKTHGKAKPNVPEMQNLNRVNVTATKTLEEASLRLHEDIATPNCAIMKNADSAKTAACNLSHRQRLVKNKSETNVTTYKTWRLKVKECKCYITCDYLVTMP